MIASTVAPSTPSDKSPLAWLPPRIQILLEGSTLTPVELAILCSEGHELALSRPYGRARPSLEKPALERLNRASPLVRGLLDYVHESKNFAPEWDRPLQEFAPMFPRPAQDLRRWLNWEFDRICSGVEQTARTMLETEFKATGLLWLDDCAKARFRWGEPIIGNPYTSFVPLVFQYRAKTFLRIPCKQAFLYLKETLSEDPTRFVSYLDGVKAGSVLDRWLDSTPFRSLHG